MRTRVFVAALVAVVLGGWLLSMWPDRAEAQAQPQPQAEIQRPNSPPRAWLNGPVTVRLSADGLGMVRANNTYDTLPTITGTLLAMNDEWLVLGAVSGNRTVCLNRSSVVGIER